MNMLTASEWTLNSLAAHLSQMARSRALHLSGCGPIFSCEVSLRQDTLDRGSPGLYKMLS